MSHHLRINDDYDAIRLELVCTAAPGSPCRLRPADGREVWTYDDADLIDSGVCWATEWADEGGWETIAAAEGVTWPLIPVTVEYEYEMGPVVAPVIPQHELPISHRERAEHAEARATAAEVASRGYRERAEKAEAKATRFAGLLAAQSRTLTDAIAAEVLRQKAASEDRQPVCGHCNEGDKGISVAWPCPTIRALGGAEC